MMPEIPAQRACLVCGSHRNEIWSQATDGEYFTTDRSYSYYRCQDCQALFIQPVPLDSLSQIYPANYYSYGKPRKGIVNQIKNYLDARLFRRLLRDLPGNTLRVLDIGGGAGWQLNLVRGMDKRIIQTQIVDMDRQAEELARSNGHEYFCGRIQDFRSQDRFDLVILLSVIEHVEDPKSVLEKISALLAPEGILLVKTPNYESLDERVFHARNWAGFHCPRHWVLFNKESFLSLAGKVSLTVKRFSFTQGAPFWAASTLYALARKRAVSLSSQRPAVNHPLFPYLCGAFALFDAIRGFFGAKTSQMFLVLRK